MIEQIAEILGLIGATLIILMYFLLEKGSVKSTDLTYPLCNLIGALMIMFSLYFNWNLPSVIIECFWIAISIYGVTKCLRKNKKLL